MTEGWCGGSPTTCPKRGSYTASGANSAWMGDPLVRIPDTLIDQNCIVGSGSENAGAASGSSVPCPAHDGCTISHAYLTSLLHPPSKAAGCSPLNLFELGDPGGFNGHQAL